LHNLAVTLRDIAKKSGLSVSIVSRVLNKKSATYRISKETERLVVRTARDLNYRPNQLAVSLRLKRSHTIGLVAPDLSNPFFAYIIKSAQGVAHGFGYTLVVCDTDESLQLEKDHVDMLQSKGVDGLVVMPVGQRAQHFESVIKNGLPVVMVDRCFEGLNTSTVVIDNRAGAFEAVEHLILHGHRKIAIVQGLPETSTWQGRQQGYKDALQKHGIPIDDSLMVGRDFRRENGYIETKLLLNSRVLPTAIFTTSDLITLGALQAIEEQGLRVPEDISIVAFDDIESADFFRCPITTVAQPKENIGELAVKLLVEQMKGLGKCEPKHIVLKPTLVVRSSVRVLPRADSAGLSVA
jgi:LacI family transcriptional regulator